MGRIGQLLHRRIGYALNKVYSKLVRKEKSYEIMNRYYRRSGAHIGNGCCICSNLNLCEKELLYIGNNVTISTQVLFVTHDISIASFSQKKGSLFGKIVIGDNCFIGERSMILYGVELANNIIVGAGSVVTKSFQQEGIILGGNPARVIGTIEGFVSKNAKNQLLIKELNQAISGNDDRLIKRG